MNENEIVKPTVVLFIICVIISVSLALTNALTKDRIEASELAEANRIRAEVMPDAEFEPLFVLGNAEISKLADLPAVVELYSALKRDGSDTIAAGYVATVLTYGYGGEIYVIVGVSAEGTLTGVRVARHSETPGLGANAGRPEFYGQYAGKDASLQLGVTKGGGANTSGGDIAAISGATVTSAAVTGAVNTAAAVINEYVRSN